MSANKKHSTISTMHKNLSNQDKVGGYAELCKVYMQPTGPIACNAADNKEDKRPQILHHASSIRSIPCH